MSNKWSIRRARHPRPAVCKESPETPDEETSGPTTIQVFLGWSYVGMAIATSFSGFVIFTRVGVGLTYTGVGIDDQLQPWDATVFLGVLSINSLINLNTQWTPYTGSNDPWPGSLPWSSTVQPMIDNNTAATGSWQLILM